MWLPSGGSLVIDRTEAMTVVDVNTGKFTGSGGNLEETVTKNNLEAAEEIVRQLRLRDIGGIIVIDFIDMVLESNRDLVLRRLIECLGRDRTRHQVAEVTSLGLVQMTRKRIGTGLLEAFSETCEHCQGRGLHRAPGAGRAEAQAKADDEPRRTGGRRGRGRGDDQGDGDAARRSRRQGRRQGRRRGRRRPTPAEFAAMARSRSAEPRGGADDQASETHASAADADGRSRRWPEPTPPSADAGRRSRARAAPSPRTPAVDEPSAEADEPGADEPRGRRSPQRRGARGRRPEPAPEPEPAAGRRRRRCRPGHAS